MRNDYESQTREIFTTRLLREITIVELKSRDSQWNITGNEDSCTQTERGLQQSCYEIIDLTF